MRRALFVAIVGTFLLGADRLAVAEPLTHAQRLEAQYAFLLGRPDHLNEILVGATEPLDLYGLAFRDLWWRRSDEPANVERYRQAKRDAEGLLARRYDWLLGGGAGPYPLADDDGTPGAEDPWPVLTSLALDRQRREARGKTGLPAESALATRPPPPEWVDWYARSTEDNPSWKSYVLDDYMAALYEGSSDAPDPRIVELGARNRIASILLVLLFVGLVFIAGRRVRAPEPADLPESPV